MHFIENKYYSIQMAKSEPSSSRIVMEPLSQFDVSTHSRTTTVRSISISTFSNSQHQNRTILFVGTHSGTLFSLSADVNDTNGTSVTDSGSFLRKLSFLRSVSVSDSPVDVVLVLADLGKVLLLSDGSLFLVDSELSNPAARLGFSKGVAVVTRRRMRNNESEGSGLDSSNQRFLHKLGGLILKDGEAQSEGGGGSGSGGCVLAPAIGKKLVIVELILGNRGGQSSVIFSLPDVSRPLRLKLLYREWRVLLVDNVGIIVDAHGPCVVASEEEKNHQKKKKKHQKKKKTRTTWTPRGF